MECQHLDTGQRSVEARMSWESAEIASKVETGVGGLRCHSWSECELCMLINHFALRSQCLKQLFPHRGIFLWSTSQQSRHKPDLRVNLNAACLPDWFPDQNASAGARTRVHLPGPEGRSPADHSIRQLHQAGAHRVRTCRHWEGIYPCCCHSLGEATSSVAWLIVTWKLRMRALGIRWCAHSEVALQEAQ